MQRFRRSTVNCLRRLPQLSIAKWTQPPPFPSIALDLLKQVMMLPPPPPLLLMLMLVLFVQLAIYYKQIYVHSWLYIQSVDRLFVCLLNSCNLRFQLAVRGKHVFFWLVRNVTHDSEEAAICITSDGRCAEDIIYTRMQEQLCYAIWLYDIHTFTTVN